MHAPELIPACAAANEAAHVWWEIGREQVQRVRKKTRMSPKDRLDAMERVEENLDDRKVVLIENCPIDRSQLMEEIAWFLDHNEISSADLLGVAHISFDEMACMNAGEDFIIGVSLPPGDDGHDTEARARAITEIVRQELMILGIPFEHDRGPRIRVLGAQFADIAALC